MTLLEHWRYAERSYWCIRSALKRAICWNKWIAYNGKKVLAFSETFDELQSFLTGFITDKDEIGEESIKTSNTAICLCVGDEKKIYRFSPSASNAIMTNHFKRQ